MDKSIIEAIKTLSHEDRVKKLRSMKLPTQFKEKFNFFTRPGSKLDLDYFLTAKRGSQHDYLAYILEEPLVMNARLIGRLKVSRSVVAKLLKRKNIDTSETNYVALDTSGEITFHPKPWLQEFESDGTFKSKGRQKISLAKLLARLGLISEKSQKLLAPHIERCTHAFKNEYTLEETTFKTAYSYPKDGWAGSSCMQGKPIESFYSSLGGIPMLLKQDGNVVGRFIKWNLPEGIYFDRLYFKEEKNLNWFKEYCKDNKIKEWNKDCQKMTMKVAESPDFDEFVPYCDTWKIYSPDTKTFYSSGGLMGIASNALYYFLENHEGSYAKQNTGKRLCQKSGKVFPSTEMIKQKSGPHKGLYIHPDYADKA